MIESKDLCSLVRNIYMNFDLFYSAYNTDKHAPRWKEAVIELPSLYHLSHSSRKKCQWEERGSPLGHSTLTNKLALLLIQVSIRNTVLLPNEEPDVGRKSFRSSL
jgi:hypothetical protein